MKKIALIDDDGTNISVMAAGLIESTWPGAFEVQRFAIAPEIVDPQAILILEAHFGEKGLGGVLPSLQSNAKSFSQFEAQGFYAVITLTGLAEEECPEPPLTVQKYFWNLPNATKFRGSPENKMEIFERVLEELSWNLREIQKYLFIN